MEKLILVPTDFTNPARVALEHAVRIVKEQGGVIELLHVCASQAEFETAKENLNKEVEWLKNTDEAALIKPVVRIGNLFETIGRCATEDEAELIIMGTHGAHGWQKIVGSDALKVINNAEKPFIVVQEKGAPAKGYKNIVVPISIHKESKQKIETIAAICQYFQSKVHMLYQQPNDEGLQRQVINNLNFSAKYLREQKISYTVTASEGNFNADTIRHAKAHNADLIAIMNIQRDTIMGSGIFGSHYEQELLTNEAQIPVLIVNPKQVTIFSNSIISGAV